MGETQRVWVFHAGALGDFVMTWPILRALCAGGAEVTVVAESGKAALAAAELGVRGVSAEQRRFTRLWVGEAEEAVKGVERVISFVADEGSEAGRRWIAGAGRMFPGARIETVGAPGSGSRARLWEGVDAGGCGVPPPRENGAGPVVVHVGGGSREKWWPLERWRELVLAVRGGALGEVLDVRAIAGEVELERFSDAERAALHELGGLFLPDLHALAAALSAARLYIGADTGPTHLAAQLGVRTLALFGPTDPRLWAPVGPAVTVLAPGSPAPMAWLPTERALRAAAAIFGRTDAMTG